MGVWIETLKYLHVSVVMKVTPFVGVWIETVLSPKYQYRTKSHTLRGCVD